MRYHWGLGVGHLHAHQPSCVPREPRGIAAPDDPIPEQLPEGGYTRITDVENDADHESNDPELALEDRELEGWDESDDLDDSDEEGSEDDDE
jgi:hypothetical protein